MSTLSLGGLVGSNWLVGRLKVNTLDGHAEGLSKSSTDCGQFIFDASTLVFLGYTKKQGATSEQVAGMRLMVSW